MTLQIDRSIPEVLILRLDRPQSRNALDLELVERLQEALGAVQARAVVLGSTDPACFCAGADITVADEERVRISERLYALYHTMLSLDVPIVAAVGGHAVGGGAQLAVAADLRIGTPSTRFRFTGPGHGLAVGGWGLPSLVGRGRALDLCLAMRPVAAEEALRIGLLDRLVDDADAEAAELARHLAALDAAAVGRIKSLVREATGVLALLERERDGNRGWSGSVAGLRRPDMRTPP
jgi:enoyl-CoA hydratase/carnithine racemase